MDVGSIPGQHFQHLLCYRCSATFRIRLQSFPVGKTGAEDRTIFECETIREHVEQSAQAGCSWCSLKLCNPDAWEDVGMTDTVSIQLRSGNPVHSYCPVGSNRYELLVNGRVLHLTAFTDTADPTSCLVTSREIQHEVGTEDVFEQASTWLAECEHHPDCPRQNKQKFPTRLIDAGLSDERLVPRVVELEDEVGFYAALSYCWGSKQTCVLKLDTLKSFKQELPVDSIPLTIRHAISCTRKLGIRYLWVDAFCIIQDSAEDKIRELASMRKIYQGAYITIVAASASNAWQGFLTDRPQPQPSYKIPAWTPDGECGIMSLRPEGWYGYEDEPVSMRAWTLEERLLSPRLLSYSSHTLQWHCQTETKNYGNSLQIPAGHTDFSLPVSFSRPDRRELTGLNETPNAGKTELRAWMSVISDYSRRLCTYPEHRLRALGGLAEEYHVRFGTEYLAGLWNGPWLCTLLLWQPVGYAVANGPKYLAPTWSWASVNSAVTYRRGVSEDKSN